MTLKWTCSLLLLVLCCTASPAGAQILRLTDLNAAQLRALDRSKTVVLLTGGMLEEHGPYLPAYTDGILSERLTQEIAQSIPRYVDLLDKNPIYQKEWIKPATAHDEALGAKEREWLRRKRP